MIGITTTAVILMLDLLRNQSINQSADRTNSRTVSFTVWPFLSNRHARLLHVPDGSQHRRVVFLSNQASLLETDN